MNWLDFIKSRYSEAIFRSPAAPQNIQRCEEALGVELPGELKALLSSTDGVLGPHGAELVWSVQDIISQNSNFRSDPDYQELYMSFGSLLLFANAKNGDMFGFPIQAGAIRRSDVFVWDHETDSRTWVAMSFTQYLDGHISGKLG